MKEHRQIIDGLRNLNRTEYPIMSGTVAAVDEANALFDVLLANDDEGIPTEGMLLNGVSGNVNGIILIPKVGSEVIVASVDAPGRYTLVRASDLDKVKVTIGNTTIEAVDGTITYNGGNNGGLTNTPELKTQLNKTNQVVNAIVNILMGAPINEPGNGNPSALQTALHTALTGLAVGDYSNIEDTHIKH